MATNAASMAMSYSTLAASVAAGSVQAGADIATLPRKFDVTALPMQFGQARWYAAYTSANHEKRVAQQLGVRELEHFLPTYSSVRRWKDRRVTLALPLFPGYVFVRMLLQERLRVLQIPGVARLVGFGGLPTAVPEGEIEALRRSLENGMRAEPHPFLTVGRLVCVRSGPLQGLQGILLRRKKVARLVVSVELIQRAIAVEMDEADVDPA